MARNEEIDFEVVYRDWENINILEAGFGFIFYKRDEKYGKNSWNDLIISFNFADGLKKLQYGIWEETKKGFEGKPMEKYDNWHWDNIEILKELCSDDNDVIKEIENKIKELIPKIEALLK